MPPSERAMLAIGTTSNEALHSELNKWTTCVTAQHKERLFLVTRIFALCKILTHNSALYSPTTMQQTQSALLSKIAGRISAGFFAPPNIAEVHIRSRDDLRSHPIRNDPSGIAERNKMKLSRSKRVQAHHELKHNVSKKTKLVITKSQKRTAFTTLRKKTCM